ncbi:MFS transporter [Azospirillum canadense]|uniref:MFS transporter n=1 Tax=Azospirillum canadense TaxID=403962 RepID=UPI002226F7BB|nr:MFS transporter [Azospirillum canadense]MCW2241411.1 ACS family tartrate transporter-like MFS transporter [Azospirillum canadense]
MTAECLQDSSAESFGRQVMRKVTWRIVPFTFLLYVISYLDRANIGYAALQMNHELALGAEAFGFASGVFFLGYFLFEVPSNVMLARYGARVWIARILVSWGVVSVLTAFVQTAEQLYVLRFLLGVAEAGFFPGIIVYLTQWFRAKEQATTIALFTAAIPVSYLMGAPLSTWLMDNVNWLGLSGWRWMIILEGGPAILGGIATFLYLVDRPEQAPWLDAREKAWLVQELEADRKARTNVRHLSTLRTMLNPKVLFLSLIYFVYQTGSLGIGYWMPQIIKGFSGTLTNTEIGLIAMVPYAIATVGMIMWSRNSDRTGERRFHSALPLLLAGAALALVGAVGAPWLAMALISMALTGLYAFKAPFWALPSLFLTRSTAAMSIAVINSIGNLGGFAGPYLIGLVKGSTGSATAGLIFLSGLLVVSFLMTALMRLEERA